MERISSASSLKRLRSSSLSEDPTSDQLLHTGKPRSGSLGDDASVSPSRRHRATRNPVVAAMLSSNTMKDCHQVRDMYFQCMDSKTDSSICATAQHYFASCKNGDK